MTMLRALICGSATTWLVVSAGARGTAGPSSAAMQAFTEGRAIVHANIGKRVRPVGIAAGRVDETFVGRQRIAANRLRQALPDIVDLRRNDEVAALRGEQAVGRRCRLVVPGMRRRLARHAKLRHPCSCSDA
jgi:hypothetical protein